MIDYVRDVPYDAGDEVIEAEMAHVRAHLSAIAAEDDDPETNADDVQFFVGMHPQDPKLLRIKGILNAEPNAPYLRDGFERLADVDPAVYAAEVARAVADEETLRGEA